MSYELALVAGRPCGPPGCAESAEPDVVVVAAARVGGILANAKYPAEFLYDNLMIEANVIDAAHRAGVAKLLFLGSSCIYPKLAPQPIKEEYLLSGPLEPTNEWYAVAKIAGLSCARPIAANTAATSSAPCRPICTARATISICRAATWYRR